MRNNGHDQLIGTSAEIRGLREEIARVARSDAKVLITGESGSGKEVVARGVHSRSPRSHRIFMPVNCAGLPETLLESELFGHVRGSFTGAYRDKPGKMETADGGTVFLDEIGEMTLRMQGLLLRFLETGELQKVGADRAAGRVNVRVIAATNRDLVRMIEQGQFREDLFYRLNVIHLVVPPLRDRPEDIVELIAFFLEHFTRDSGHYVRTIAPEAIAALVKYDWPGNVRELENVIERLVVVGQHEVARLDDLPLQIRAPQLRPAPGGNDTPPDVVDDLYARLTKQRESFWTAVYPLYMQREITRSHVRDLVRKGLYETHGNYKIVVRLFNMEPTEYKRFLNFLRKHDCQLPFQDFRQPDRA